MFGSDWPVCLLASDYAGVMALARSLTAGLSAAERAAVFGGTAARAYRLTGRGQRAGAAGTGQRARERELNQDGGSGAVALTDEAIGKIKEMIISGRVRPGEKLPREADLAAELGLSRNSLREAVKALTLVNVLDVRQGDGTYATSLAPSLLLEALSFIVDFHRTTPCLSSSRCAASLSPPPPGWPRCGCPRRRRPSSARSSTPSPADSPVDDFVATDLEFHKKIALGAGNSVLASLVDNMSLPTVAGPGLARHDRAAGPGAHAGRAPGHPPRDPVRRPRPGPVLGDGAHRRHRVLAAHHADRVKGLAGLGASPAR